MAVKIRLKRCGKRNAPSYRIVVADVRSARDGRFIEEIGTYNPQTKTEAVDVARADYWLSVGAQANGTVQNILKRVKSGKVLEVAAPKGQTAPSPKKVEAPVVEEAPAEEVAAEETAEA